MKESFFGVGMDGNFMNEVPVILIFLCITGTCATIAGCTTSTPQKAGLSARTGVASSGGTVQVNTAPDLTNQNSPLAAAFNRIPQQNGAQIVIVPLVFFSASGSLF